MEVYDHERNNGIAYTLLAFQGGAIEDVHISLGGVHLLAMLCSLEEVGRGSK